MGKNKHVKKKWHTQQNKADRNLCGCYYCVGTDYIEWLKLKYFVKPKHRKNEHRFKTSLKPPNLGKS